MQHRKTLLMRPQSSISAIPALAIPAIPVGGGVPLDRALAESSHEAAVDAWLARSDGHDSSVEVVRRFRSALEAIWDRAVAILGPVTLTAIAKRVLHNASERYTFLSFLSTSDTRSNGGASGRERLYERLATIPRDALSEGLRWGLIELLTIIGALTAEVLRDELHAALEAVAATPEPRVPAGGRPHGEPLQ